MIKSALIYFFGSALNKAIPFLLLPVLTRYLSPGEYGTLAIVQVLLSLTIPLVGMNMHNNISRNYSKIDSAEMGKLIGTLTGLLGVTTGIVGGVAAVWCALVGDTLGLPGYWFLILPLVAALSMAHQFNLTTLRNQKRPIVFGIYEISNTVFDLLLSLALVVGLGFGWQGRAAGVALAAGCFGLVGLLVLRRQKLLIFHFERRLVVEVLQISLPLIPHALGGVVIAMSDRLFIDRMISKEAVGLYAVGYAFGMIVNLMVEAFNRAWSPWFYREINDGTESGRKRIVRFTYVYFGCVLLSAVVVTILSYLVLPYMVTTEYQSSAQFILWIALGYAFRGMYTMVFPYLVHIGKTSFLGFGMMLTAGVNLVLNFVLIQKNGAVGAAQATLIAWLMLFLLTWAYSARICPMPWMKFLKGSR